MRVSVVVCAMLMISGASGGLYGEEGTRPADVLRPGTPEPPAVSVCEAVALAELWLGEHDEDAAAGQHIDSVSLRWDDAPETRGRYWLVQWMWVEPRLGGELSVRVDMEGRVSATRLGP